VIEGLIIGVGAAVAWAVILWAARWLRYLRDYAGLSGQYRVEAKDPNAKYPHRVLISARRNVLHVHFTELPEGDWVRGEIVMSEALRRTGRGHYEHLKADEPLWGFWDIQIAADERTIFVHTTFANPPFAQPTVEGFRWCVINLDALNLPKRLVRACMKWLD